MSITQELEQKYCAAVSEVKDSSTSINKALTYKNDVLHQEEIKWQSKKSRIVAQASEQEEIETKRAQDLVRDQQEIKQEIEDYEKILKRYGDRDSSRPSTSSIEAFTSGNAVKLLKKIRDRSFFGWVKKTLTVGGYSNNKLMIRKLYNEIDAAYNYTQNEIRNAECSCNDAIDRIRKDSREQLEAEEKRYKSVVKVEEDTYTTKLSQIREKTHRKLKASAVSITSLQNKNYRVWGLSEKIWDKYEPVGELPDSFLIGAELLSSGIEQPSSEEKKMLSLIPYYSEKVNGFSIPYAVESDKPILIWTECPDSDNNYDVTADFYQSIIGRMIRSMPIKTFKVHFFDPVNRGTSLGKLIHLSGEDTSELCKTYTEVSKINETLKQINNHIDDVCAKLAGTGCVDIREYNRIHEDKKEPYTVLVIQDYPNGLNATGIDYLKGIVSKAEQCGISILVSHKQKDVYDNKVYSEFYEQIKSQFTIFELVKNGFGRIISEREISKNTKFKVLPINLTKAYMDGVNKCYTYRAPIENSFSKLFDNGNAYIEKRSSKHGLDIPFAVDENGEIIELKIGYDLSAYGLISGGPGSGKSTLLHTIITSSIMYYEPSELELWLIDHKIPEFSFYINNCPPHVRYVVADDSEEISYSILDEISSEIKRRNKTFVNARVKDYVGYRATAEYKKHPMPRLLILIDEFHRMSQAASADAKYKTMLENILSEARSSGISMLFSDQLTSQGLSGLSDKGKAMISVRIALRNDPAEVKATLAIQSGQLTDEVTEMINDISSGIKGSIIYKFERIDLKENFSNEVLYKSCRAIYAVPEEREAVIKRLLEEYKDFEREKVFFSGVARLPMDMGKIQRYEETIPQSVYSGDRFYIGTPLGIQPCFHLNLKPGEPGEDILIVGSENEKRLALFKAVLINAKRYGYNVQIYAATKSEFFRTNKSFFASLENVETKFSEICRFIGENANKIKSYYDDYDDQDDYDYDDEEDVQKEKTLIIFIGMDELYERMDASTLTQKDAWKTQEKEGKTEETKTISKDGQSEDKNRVDLSDDKTNQLNTPEKTESNFMKSKRIDMSALYGELDAINSDSKKSREVAKGSIPESYASLNYDVGIRGYNAIKDLELLLDKGWKFGMNYVCILDRGTVINRMKQIKMEGKFNHRIAMAMPVDEASIFMKKSEKMNQLINKNDENTCLYSYMGGTPQCFRPYIFQ